MKDIIMVNADTAVIAQGVLCDHHGINLSHISDIRQAESVVFQVWP
jgi:hypothetical protein